MRGTVEHFVCGASRHTFTFCSDAVGNASILLDGIAHPQIVGRLFDLVTSPDGDNPPSANWDVTLETWNRFDTLLSEGVNRSATQVKTKTLGASLGNVRLQDLAGDAYLTLHITNAGDTKKGRLSFYVLPIEAK